MTTPIVGMGSRASATGDGLVHCGPVPAAVFVLNVGNSTALYDTAVELQHNITLGGFDLDVNVSSRTGNSIMVVQFGGQTWTVSIAKAGLPATISNPPQHKAPPPIREPGPAYRAERVKPHQEAKAPIRIAPMASLSSGSISVSQFHCKPQRDIDWTVDADDGFVIHRRTGRYVLCNVCQTKIQCHLELKRDFHLSSGKRSTVWSEQPIILRDGPNKLFHMQHVDCAAYEYFLHDFQDSASNNNRAGFGPANSALVHKAKKKHDIALKRHFAEMAATSRGTNRHFSPLDCDGH